MSFGIDENDGTAGQDLNEPPKNIKAARNKRKKEGQKLRKAEASRIEREEENALHSSRGAVEQSELSVNQHSARHIDYYDTSSMDGAFVIQPTDTKSLGVFATGDIKKGTAILKEAPLISGTTDYLAVEASFLCLTEENKTRFMNLSAICRCEKSTCKESIVQKIWNANCFEVPRELRQSKDVGHIARSVYDVASRFNHGCMPNATYDFTHNAEIVIRTLRQIHRWEEITIFYGTVEGGPVARRQAATFKKYGFQCKCNACYQKRTVNLSPAAAVIETVIDCPDSEVLEIVRRTTEEEDSAVREACRWSSCLQARLHQWRDEWRQNRLSTEDVMTKYEALVRMGGSFGVSDEVIADHLRTTKEEIQS